MRAAVFLAVFLAAGSSLAQFRNNGVIMPSIGYHGLGEQDLVTWALGNYVEPLSFVDSFEWNTSPHLTIGAGYSRALGYNLWLVNEFAIGGGFGIKYVDINFPPPVFSIHASTGLRYNFLDEEYRPFVSGYVHYIQLFSLPQAQLPTNDFGQLQLGSFGSFWVGARLGGGFEWFFMTSLRKWGIDVPLFYDEMSVQAEGTGAAFINLRGPLVSAVARFSYLVYF